MSQASRRATIVLATGTLLAALVLTGTVQAFSDDGPPLPGGPILVSPANGASSPEIPTLTWLPARDALYYDVTVRTPGQTVGGCGGEVRGHLTFQCEDLAPGTYVWKVTSHSIEGAPGGTSVTRTFTRTTPPMSAPQLTAPANAASIDYPDALGMLRWQPVLGAALYELEVSTSPTFADLHPTDIGGTGDLSAEVPRDHIGVPEYWRVRGVSSDRLWAGPWSLTRSFTVTWTDVPTPLSPADGASVSNIILRWSPVKGATNYDVQVAAIGDVGFANAEMASPWPIKTWLTWGSTPASDLRWRVRARNEYGGTTAWSAARTLVRDNAAPITDPPAPLTLPTVQVTSPADGATLPDTWDHPIQWAMVAGATRYEIEIDDLTLGGTGSRIVATSPLLWRPDRGSTVRFRVRGLGDNGEVGAWSAYRQVTIGPVATITLLSPADGAVVSADSPRFEWSPFLDSSYYQFQLSRTTDFSGPSEVTLGVPYVSPRSALWPGRWYWRVVAGNGGILGVSAPRAIDVLDTLPPAAGLSFSAGAYTLQSTTSVGVDAVDDIGTVDQVGLSADGVTWETHNYGPGTIQWSLTSVAHGGSSPGQRTVYARYEDDSGNWSEPIAASIWYGMEPPVDDTPPTGSVTIADGAASTRSIDPVVAVPASDVGGVTTVAISTDGVTWDERPYWDLQQVTLSPSNGAKTVWVKWRDWALNWSPVASDTIVLDTVAPTSTAPTSTFVGGSTVTGGIVPTKFSWSGSDATSGIGHYEAALSTDGGAYATISTALGAATITRNLSAGHTYRLEVRGVDRAGNVGSWVAGSTLKLSAFQDSSASIIRTGTWAVSSSSSYWGGTTRSATSAGVSARLTFTGRTFAWIGAVGPTRGSAKVYVNGVLVKTVSLYASSIAYRRVLVALSWSTSASRTIRIVVVGTSGHPRVDLDALVTGT